ncbi:MAG: SHOCT domain-containing protein [Gaiellaceae bacterium]
MDGWDGGMSVAGWLLMTVFWVALIGVIVWAVGNLFPSRRDGSAVLPERPEEVLDQRLARGEIDAATYDELRGKLRTARAERV